MSEDRQSYAGCGLPNSWRRVALKDIADSIQYGHTASAVARADGPRFLRITDIQDGRVDWNAVPSCDIPESQIPKYRLSSGDLVFARTGATTGKSFLIRDCPDAVFASYLIRVRVSADIDSRYLSAFFQSPDYWRQIEGGKRGIGQPNVNGTVLGEIQLPVPPIPEQREIVAEIEKQFTRLDAGVAALRRVQVNLKRYRAALLKAACEGRLVPTEAELAKAENRNFETGEELLARILAERRNRWKGSGKYKEPAEPDIAKLGALPDRWRWASVAQVSATIVDCPHSTAKFVNSGLPCVDTTCIKPGRIVREKLRFVSADSFKKRVERLVPATDDIVFAREGTVGTAVAIPADVQPCLGQRVMLMRADACITPAYFEHCLNSQVVRAQYLPKIVGSTAPHINVAEVKQLAIPLPPLVEQERIAAEVEKRLSAIEDLEAVISANLQRATRLRQSILQKAFSGELSTRQ
jgi:type I restriction enzyme, S subunit